VEHALPLVGISSLTNPPPRTQPANQGASFEQRLAAAGPELSAYGKRLLSASPLAAGRHLDYEDLVQDTMARALVFQANFDASRPLGPWLSRMLLRLFLDHRRRAFAAPDWRAKPSTNDGTPLDEMPSTGTDHMGLDTLEEAEYLLDKLAEPERAILDRFHRGGEPIAQISAALGLPVGTTKSHLHRARLRLRELALDHVAHAPSASENQGDRLHD
jgi:RNA polymerase sigma factor (sigma-70 family)